MRIYDVGEKNMISTLTLHHPLVEQWQVVLAGAACWRLKLQTLVASCLTMVRP